MPYPDAFSKCFASTGHDAVRVINVLWIIVVFFSCFNKLEEHILSFAQILTSKNQSMGDPRLYVCQAPNAFICVSPCGSIFGPFLVHFGSIFGPFLIHFWSIFGPFLVHFWSISGPFRVHFGSMLGPCWVHFGSIWGPRIGIWTRIDIYTRIGIQTRTNVETRINI